jgi:hypothetical protein
VELCQVGIEKVQGVHNGRLMLRSSGRIRITEDSESSARWALSGRVGAQKTGLLNVMGEDTLPGGNLS